MIRQDILDRFRLQPGKNVRLKDHGTGWAQTKELKELGKDVVKDRAREILDKNLEDLAGAQELLYADDRYALLIVLQAMDAARTARSSTSCPESTRKAARSSASRSPPPKSWITTSSGAT